MSFSTVINETKLQENFDKLLQTIKDTFGEESDRSKKLTQMYLDLEDQVKVAPASGKLNFHNAYEGGYLDHIFNVLDCARLMKKLYAHQGGTIDFTDEELVFTALHHDLGKVGLEGEPYYVIQDSDWHRRNKLEIFKHNEDIQFMTVSDRTLFLLQMYAVQLTQKEFLAIKLTDGLYDEAAKKYLIQYGAGFYPMRTNLHKIMHWADHMAASIENDLVRNKPLISE